MERKEEEAKEYRVPMDVDPFDSLKNIDVNVLFFYWVMLTICEDILLPTGLKEKILQLQMEILEVDPFELSWEVE